MIGDAATRADDAIRSVARGPLASRILWRLDWTRDAVCTFIISYVLIYMYVRSVRFVSMRVSSSFTVQYRPRASEWGDFGMGPSTASDALASSSKVAATNANALSSNLLSASSAGAVPTGAVSAANSMSMSGGEQMAMSFGYGLPPIADGHAAEQYRAAMPMPFQSVGGPQPPFMPQYGPPPGYMPPSGWYELTH